MNFKKLIYTTIISVSLLSVPISAMQADESGKKEESEKLWFDCLSELNPTLAHNLLELIITNPHLKPCLELKQSDVNEFFFPKSVESVRPIEIEIKKEEQLWIDCLRTINPGLAEHFLKLTEILPMLKPWLLLKQCEAEKIVTTVFENQSI